MAIDAQKEGELGCLTAMYHIFEKGASPGLSPETGKERTVKYEKWMETKIPLPPKNQAEAKKFNAMLDGFDLYLSNGDKSRVTKTTKKGIEFKNAAWVNTWISQALSMKKYIKNKGLSVKGWKYGWWNDSRVSDTGIPDMSSSLQCVWDNILSKDDRIKAILLNKDSWDPADVYIITSKGEKEIDEFCPDLYKEFESVEDAMKMENSTFIETFISTVNSKLCNLVRSGDLLPISLKAQTTQVTMTVKEANINPLTGGKIDQVRGYFTTKPSAHFTLSNRGGKLDFGPTNSLKFEAFTRGGGYTYPYIIEQRMAGPKSKTNKQEIKDIKTKDGGGEKKANNQAGSIPVQRFETLISKWAYAQNGNVKNAPSNKYHSDIPPVGSELSDDEVEFWASEYDSLSKSKVSFGESGTTTFNLGETSILGVQYDTKTYFSILRDLDQADAPMDVLGESARDIRKDNLSGKLRNKLYNLRFFRALVNAYDKKVDGHPQLCMLLLRLYFLAAKMKLSDKDLNGPFLKIS